MSDPTRLRILCLLRNEELCVCEILKSLELPQNLVSHHLRVLREAGLIDGARDGKFMRYSSLSSNLQQKLEEVLSVFVKK
jgi:ArsR family transcriptional regulator